MEQTQEQPVSALCAADTLALRDDLIDVSKDAHTAGYDCPVYLTPAMWRDIANIPADWRDCQTAQERVWDVLWQACFACVQLSGSWIRAKTTLVHTNREGRVVTDYPLILAVGVRSGDECVVLAKPSEVQLDDV